MIPFTTLPSFQVCLCRTFVCFSYLAYQVFGSSCYRYCDFELISNQTTVPSAQKLSCLQQCCQEQCNFVQVSPSTCFTSVTNRTRPATQRAHHVIYRNRAASVHCPDGYEYMEGLCLSLTKVPYDVNWAMSQAECQSNGGRLAVVKDVDIQTLLGWGSHHDCRYWVGARLADDNTFRWSDGTLLPDDSSVWWASGPEKRSYEQYVGVRHGFMGMDDMFPWDYFKCFLCESTA